jgi:hypothetical protein
MMRALVLTAILCAAGFFGSTAAQAERRGIRDSQLTMLRVHEVETKYGPDNDQINVEVVITLANHQGAFGFQLRPGSLADANNSRLARQGMLDLLRDAFNHNWRVNIDYDIAPQKTNGYIVRVWLTKP